jgi:DNA-binding response OmpR family regulator
VPGVLSQVPRERQMILIISSRPVPDRIREEFDITQAFQAETGVAIALHERHDVIAIDGQVSGARVACRVLRSKPQTATTPIMLMATAEKDDTIHTRYLGAWHVVSTVSEDELVGVFRCALANSYRPALMK